MWENGIIPWSKKCNWHNKTTKKSGLTNADRKNKLSSSNVGTRQTCPNLLKPQRESLKNSFPNSSRNSAVKTLCLYALHSRDFCTPGLCALVQEQKKNDTNRWQLRFFPIVATWTCQFSTSQLQPCSSLFLFKEKSNDTRCTCAPQASTKGHCLL